MTELANNELWSIFDARRVKAPELKGLDATANALVGVFKNRRPVRRRLWAQVQRIEKLEPEIHNLGSTRFAEEVAACRDLARLGKLKGEHKDRAIAIIREASVRSKGMRPFAVQLMGALAIT